jgi:hypothetical protein
VSETAFQFLNFLGGCAAWPPVSFPGVEIEKRGYNGSGATKIRRYFDSRIDIRAITFEDRLKARKTQLRRTWDILSQVRRVAFDPHGSVNTGFEIASQGAKVTGMSRTT